MTPVLQTQFGSVGNCFAACVASLLDEPIEGFSEMFPVEGDTGDDWHRKVNATLLKRGLFFLEIPIEKFNYTLPDGCFVMLGVVSPNSRNHAIVGRVELQADLILFHAVHCPLGTDVEFYKDRVTHIILLANIYT